MLIVHHWDTDGICSAAKLVKALKPESYVNMSPEIGDFSFSQRIKDAIKEHDEVYVLDLNLPHEVEGASKKVVFIDHHIQGKIQNDLVEQINPLLDGKDPKDYPSCTTVLSDLFGDWDLLSALGAVGDVGEKALEVTKVREQLELAGIGFQEAQHIVSLIDSNYLAVDLASVEEAVRIVLSSGIEELRNRPEWVERFDDIQRTIEDSLATREDMDGFTLVDYSSPYNIVSKLARKAVWEMGYSGALVINRDFHGKGQTYFRVSPETASRIDIASIIARLKDIGINAGGKREVVGSVYPLARTEEVLAIIRPHLPIRKQGGNSK